MTTGKIVAHRGYAAQYPENTLVAIHRALELGVCGIEVDVQLTRDQVPVLFHDDNMQRVTGLDRSILETDYAEFRKIPVSEATRLGQQFMANPSASLEELVDVIQSYPEREYFIEIKQESIDHFGLATVGLCVDRSLRPVANSLQLISYNLDFLLFMREQYAYEIGWVFTHWDEKSLQKTEAARPETVICNYQKIPNDFCSFNQYHNEWMLYEITDPALAVSYVQQGIQWIETMEVEQLTSDPVFRDSLCMSR
jgi:glycerophosphoryl diester phosphodiesterase